MCIIAAKAKGVKMPSTTTIENMWFNNPDGAGFMYVKDGKVCIEKGFMKLSDLESALERVNEKTNLEETSVVLHFRIATHGGVLPANTHPFPVSSSIGMLQKLRCTASLGVAHNGIIDITPRKGISDTMEYVATQLAPLYKGVPEFYLNPHLMEMVDNAITSKLAIMNGKGEIYTIGKFEEEDGILYSNTTYKTYYLYGKFWDNKWKDYYLEDEYGVDSPSYYRYKEDRLLRWFDFDEEVTCCDSKGNWIDNYEYDLAVDSDGHLYRYDYNIDGFVKIIGGRAYDKKGQTLYAVDDEYKLTTLESIFEFEPDIAIARDKTKGGKTK